MLRSLSTLSLAVTLLVSTGVNGELVEVLLFAGSGKSKDGENTWAGWYEPGHIVSSGYGKRSAYDTEALEALIFRDDSGREIQYNLVEPYLGLSLLQIVVLCMGSDRFNLQNKIWEEGHCTRVGTRVGDEPLSVPLLNPFVKAKVSPTLRIGVGDGMGDPKDWCLIMLEPGNGGGDMGGMNVYCFGSENETNTGHKGDVSISGLTKVTGTTTATTTNTVEVLPVQELRIKFVGPTSIGSIVELKRSAVLQLEQFLAEIPDGKEVLVTATVSEEVTTGVTLVLRLDGIAPSKYLILQAHIQKLWGPETFAEKFTHPLNEDLGFSLDALLLKADETAEDAQEEPSPWGAEDPNTEGDNPMAVAVVVASSVFLTACPFVCASLWCFCRRNHEGEPLNKSKEPKKGVSGIDAETDIISMIEEMGGAPDPLAVHAPVCVTLNNGLDSPSSPSSLSAWRTK